MTKDARGRSMVTSYTFTDAKNSGVGTPHGHPAFGSQEEEQRAGAWFAEMQKAGERLRSFPDKNGNSDLRKPWAAAIRWAIHLADVDLSSLSEGQVRDLQYEFEAFVTFEMQAPHEQLRNIDGPSYTKETIATAQTWLKRNLSSLVDGRIMEYRAPEEQHVLSLPEKGQSPLQPSWTEPVWHHLVATKFGECPASFFRLLTMHVEAFHRCEASDCRAVFLRDRHDQRYCSKGCLWRMTTRHRRGTPVERFGKRGRPPKVAIVITPKRRAPRKSLNREVAYSRARRNKAGKKTEDLRKKDEKKKTRSTKKTKKGASR